jgi:hypothetical protein
MKVVVSLGSQVHQMPHTGRARSGPVISPIVQQTGPTAPADTPKSSHRSLRVERKAILETNAAAKT